MIKWIKENRSLTEINKDLEKNMTQNNTVERAIANLKGDIYFDKWCKPLLFMIEYAQSDDSNLNFLAIWDRNIHTEHILPKAYKKKQSWKLFVPLHANQESGIWKEILGQFAEKLSQCEKNQKKGLG